MPAVEDAQALDSQGMLAATLALPEQVEAASKRATGLSPSAMQSGSTSPAIERRV